MIKRNLDNCYFRVCRDGKWENVCFSDLSYIEREKAVKGWSADALFRLACILADAINVIGDRYDIYGG